jgi:hypothetical protein
MSRRPPDGGSDDSCFDRRPERRRLTPAGSAPSREAIVPSTDIPSVPVCETWLALDAEHRLLIERWQKLESKLVARDNWFSLPPQEREALPEAAQLEAIGNQLDDIAVKRQELLRLIPLETCASASGLKLKLAVALACVPEDENEEAHRIVKSAMTDLAALLEANACL